MTAAQDKIRDCEEVQRRTEERYRKAAAALQAAKEEFVVAQAADAKARRDTIEAYRAAENDA